MTRQARRNAVIYQIYPRSFFDNNGDGIGDIAGITTKLDYLQWLGVDGIWLSPVFTSPMADMGYDVADYCNIDPMFGTIADMDRLVDQAHTRGLVVLLDIVPCHTSIQHPWFREHPDWYVWHDGDKPPNNWASVFGGPAWSRDVVTEKWYLHTFYPEQPLLNWRNPEVPKAIEQVMHFWLDRGIDGFRIDAIECLFVDKYLRDEPLRSEPRLSGTAHPDWLRLDHVYTKDLPEVVPTLRKLSESLPHAFLVAEVYHQIPELIAYTEAVDLTFCFSLTSAQPTASSVRSVIEECVGVEGLAWAMSNHDISRLASRWGTDLARVGAMLLLTLPGASFIYQGDEIAMTDGPGTDPRIDRIGRDGFRHPMQWTAAGGFSDGEPWLPMVNPETVNVETQMNADNSMLSLYKQLIRVHHEMSGPLELVSCRPIPELVKDGDVVCFRRGSHIVVLNFGNKSQNGPAIEVDKVLVATRPDLEPTHLPPYSGYVGVAQAR